MRMAAEFVNVSRVASRIQIVFEGAVECAPQEERTFNRITGMTDGEREIIALAGEREAKNAADSQEESPEERAIRAFDTALDEWFGEDLAKVRQSRLAAHPFYSTAAFLQHCSRFSCRALVRPLVTPRMVNRRADAS
jgi:hypothetical protein